MQILQGETLRTTCLRKTSVALGTFDAMHKGHRAVICEAVRYARKMDMLPAVYLFRIPPKNILGGGIQCVNSLEKRLEILEELGVEIAVVEEFSLEYAQISCREFIHFLKEHLGAQAVYAGFNYHFGKGGKGDAQELRRLCGENNIACEILSCIFEEGVVSSSRIRDLIESGHVEEAERFLCRPFSVRGKVMHGNHFGRMIGFPTANMEIPSDLVIPADGVYSSRVCRAGNTYPAITNIGNKPTVAEAERNIETHIIGFSGDLYGKTMEVEFIRRLRGIVRFRSAEELKQQLEADKQTAVKEYAKYNC